jgi:hypothetical protein
VSRRLPLSAGSVQTSFFSDYYYLAFADDPFKRQLLIYAVYAAELAQSILLAKRFYQEFAVGFGNYEAINASGILWFTVPIIGSIGVYHPLFGCCRSFSHK